MKKRVIFFLLAVFCVFPVFAPKGQAAALYNSELEPRSGILYLKSLDDGTVIFDRGATERCAPAALTSIAAAMVVLNTVSDLEQPYTVPADINERLAGTDSAIMLLKGGEHIRVIDLLYCILIRSAADASVTLAVGTAGSEEAFVLKMNEYASSIGCQSTHFANVTGLDDENQYTTASDMARLMTEASKNDLFKKISTTETYEVPATDMSDARSVYTTNYMIKSSYPSYYYEYITAAKVGATSNAGRCVALTASRDGYSYVAVVLKGEYLDTDEDGTPENYAFIDCRDMLRWTFSNIRLRTIVDVNQTIGEMEVKYSLRNDHVRLVPAGQLTVLVPSSVGTDNVVFEIIDGQTEDFVKAPVKKGEVLGKANVLYGGSVIAVIDIAAAEDIPFDLPGYLLSAVKNIVLSPVFICCLLVVLVLVVLYAVGFRYDRAKRRIVRQRRKKRSAARK